MEQLPKIEMLSAKVPQLFSTETVPPGERIAQVHFVTEDMNIDWFICECDPHTQNLFGLKIEKGNFSLGKWGYFTLPEIEAQAGQWNKKFEPNKVGKIPPFSVHIGGQIRIIQ